MGTVIIIIIIVIIIIIIIINIPTTTTTPTTTTNPSHSPKRRYAAPKQRVRDSHAQPLHHPQTESRTHDAAQGVPEQRAGDDVCIHIHTYDDACIHIHI